MSLHKNARDLKHQRFGSKFVLCLAPKRDKHIRWMCECDCGRIHAIRARDILHGTNKCMCYGHNHKHGHSKIGAMTPTYQSWAHMIQRCTNPNNIGWLDYGGIGITVCEQWLVFENFLTDMGERPEGTTLHRLNNSMVYGPGLCEWATWKVQNNRANKKEYLSNGN